MGLGYGDAENPFDLATQDVATIDYSPNQPRDKDGKWTGGGLNSGVENSIINSVSAKGVNKFSKGFSKENLKEHFNNHGHQYANMTAEDYNNYALYVYNSL